LARVTETDANGDYTLAGLVPGSYTITVDKSGYTSHQGSLSFAGGAQVVPDISLKPLAQVNFKGTRTDTSYEIWGAIVARGGGREIRSTVRFAAGRSEADDGFSTGGATLSNPVLYLDPNVSYDIRAEIPGLNSSPLLAQTFTAGQIYDWTVSFGAKAGLIGQVQIANGALNASGVPVRLMAGLDANSDNLFDLGYPSFFANTYIPAGEQQASYNLPGLGAGRFRVMCLPMVSVRKPTS
jgi:hypothetical protein